MFQPWRIQLREAEAAFRVGQLDEAGRLLCRDGLREFLPGKQLSLKVAEQLTARGKQHLAQGDTMAGWHDWEAATYLAGETESLTKLREELVGRALADAERLLAADNPAAAKERLERLRGHRVDSSRIRTLLAVAEHVQTALRMEQAGDYRGAEGEWRRAVSLRTDLVSLEKRLDQCRLKMNDIRTWTGRLHTALAARNWRDVLEASDELLRIVPDSAEVREVRGRAWNVLSQGLRQTIVHDSRAHSTNNDSVNNDSAGNDSAGNHAERAPNRKLTPARVEDRGVKDEAGKASGPQHTQSNEPLGVLRRWGWLPRFGARGPALRIASQETPRATRSSEADTVTPPGDATRFLLWVDAVGGYLVCMGDEVVLGQPVAGGPADVPILADLSRRHATIRRDGECYTIGAASAAQPIKVDGRTLDGAALLTDGNMIDLGHGVRLRFRRPHPMSATARLEFDSHHRTRPGVDAVLLMAATLVLGPKTHSHVVCRNWTDDVVLYREGNSGGSCQLACRAGQRLEIDGVRHDKRGPITTHSHVCGEGFSFNLEDLSSD